MKKRVALTAAAVALVGTLAVGGTLAWFTDTETATNVVTMGEVDIKLSEDGGTDGIIKDGGLKYDDVMPGDTFTKKVTIENLEQAAWIRAKIEVTDLDDVTTTNTDHIKFYKDDKEVSVTWAANGDGTGYVGPVKMEANDAEDYILFDSIKVPSSWGNEFVNQEMTIKVSVEAVQYENNTTAESAFNDYTENYGGVSDLGGTVDAVGSYTGETTAAAEEETTAPAEEPTEEPTTAPAESE